MSDTSDIRITNEPGRAISRKSIDEQLAALPEIPLSATTSNDVRRKARLSFLAHDAAPSYEADGPVLVHASPLRVLCTRTVLPAVLLFMGAMYTVSSVAQLARVYLPH